LAAALYFSPGRQAYVSGANQAATAGRTGFQSGQNSIARLRRWPLEDGAMDGRNAQLAVIPDDVAVKRVFSFGPRYRGNALATATPTAAFPQCASLQFDTASAL
jgi:hypothetical protein